MSVSSLVKGSGDNILYTGSSDGLIRVISVLPNSLKGTIGDCKQDIECLSLSFNDKWYLNLIMIGWHLQDTMKL